MRTITFISVIVLMAFAGGCSTYRAAAHFELYSTGNESLYGGLKRVYRDEGRGMLDPNVDLPKSQGDLRVIYEVPGSLYGRVTRVEWYRDNVADYHSTDVNVAYTFYNHADGWHTVTCIVYTQFNENGRTFVRPMRLTFRVHTYIG